MSFEELETSTDTLKEASTAGFARACPGMRVAWNITTVRLPPNVNGEGRRQDTAIPEINVNEHQLATKLMYEDNTYNTSHRNLDPQLSHSQALRMGQLEQ